MKNGNDSYFQKVTLSDPEKVSDKFRGRYVTYKVHLLTNNPIFSTNESTVIRRYSDFLWLYNQLCKSFPGAIIPPLPAKQGLGRFLQYDTGFIELRRICLELFLNRIVNKTEMLFSEDLHSFLEFSESKFSSIRNISVDEVDVRSSVISILQSTMSSMGINNSNTNYMERTETDLKFEDMMQTILQIELQLQAVQRHITAFIKKDQQVSQNLYEISKSLGSLGRIQQDSLSKPFTDIYSSTKKLSLQGGVFADKLFSQVEMPLSDLLRYLNEIKLAYQRRQTIRLNYFNALHQHQQLQHQYSVSSSPNNTNSIHKDALKKSFEEINSAQQLLELTSMRFERDYLEVKSWFMNELKCIITKFLRLEVETHENAERSWLSMYGKWTTSIDNNNNNINPNDIHEDIESISNFSKMVEYEDANFKPESNSTLGSLLSSMVFSDFMNDASPSSSEKVSSESKKESRS